MYGDCKYKRALNSYGDKIKTHIEDTSVQLNGIASFLTKYEGKQNTCQNYKTVVQEYAKAKKELQHSRQTLSILLANDSPACRSNKP